MPVSFALPLKPCETGTSYTSRSARELGLNSPDELCTELGLYWPFVARGDLDHFECLARVCGANLDELIHWSVRQVDRKQITLCGEVLSNNSMSRTRPRVCPVCIMEDIATGGITNAYRRNYWQPLWIGCCEDHETELVQLPYHEHSKKNYDFTGRIDEHIDLIREHSKSARRSTFPSFDRYVKTRLAGQKQIPFLDSFNLDIACRLCETLGASLIAPETKLRRFAAEDWYTICQEGFNVVQAGENAFLDALAQLRRDATDGQTKYRQNLGPLYEWLRRARECKDVKRLKDCVSDFVFQSYPIKKGTQVLRRTCPETMNFHAASASEVTGIYEYRMRKIVRQTETTSFRRDELEKIVASAEGSLNRKEACCFLGLPKRLFSILLRSEIVKSIQIQLTLIESTDSQTCSHSFDGSKQIPFQSACQISGSAMSRKVMDSGADRLPR